MDDFQPYRKDDKGNVSRSGGVGMFVINYIIQIKIDEHDES